MEAPKTVFHVPPQVSTLSGQILESLRRIHTWYHSMIDLKSERFVYEYDATNHTSTMENCPIRDLGSVWDLSVLLQFEKQHNINLTANTTTPASSHYHSIRLESKIQDWISYYLTFVVPFRSFRHKNHNLAHLNTSKLEEPASIAHNAFLILCLVTDEISQKTHLETARSLCEGIVSQQRTDGSYKIFFSDVRDAGVELYAGESMLALLKFYELTKDPHYLHSVEAAFPFYRDYYTDGNLPETVTVFFFNWMAQSLKLLYSFTENEATKESIIQMLIDLQEDLIQQGFYTELKNHPKQVATVQIACALEGLADLCWILSKEKMEEQLNKHKEYILLMTQFLLSVQNKDVKNRGFGGFGHGLTYHVQRIDVTGHVLSAFIKVLEANLV